MEGEQVARVQHTCTHVETRDWPIHRQPFTRVYLGTMVRFRG